MLFQEAISAVPVGHYHDFNYFTGFIAVFQFVLLTWSVNKKYKFSILTFVASIFTRFYIQAATHGVLIWCLRGLIHDIQETTLYNIFDIMDNLLQPSFQDTAMDELGERTSTALSLLERDFPVTVQVRITPLDHIKSDKNDACSAGV